ncbi:MAG TPA: hypothetical protein VIL32_09415 [Steroidobacteraceae bacterium]
MKLQANPVRIAISGLSALILTTLMLACLSDPLPTVRSASAGTVAAAEDKMPEIVISASRLGPAAIG